MATKTDKGTIFYNADYIVIEYIDIVKSPYLLLLHAIQQNENLSDIFKMEEIELLDDEGLYEWYINRKHQNFLMDLNRYPDKVDEKTLDNILETQINLSPEFYTDATPLIITDMLITLTHQKISNGIIIYHPHKNDYAKKDLESLIGGDYIFMDDFDKVLEKAGSNSTYFLSDIRKVTYMKEKGFLRCSSITLPVEYRYNKKNMEDFSVDFEALYKDEPYKLTFFRACTQEHLMQPSDEIKEAIKENDPDADVENINVLDFMKEIEKEFNELDEVDYDNEDNEEDNNDGI